MFPRDSQCLSGFLWREMRGNTTGSLTMTTTAQTQTSAKQFQELGQKSEGLSTIAFLESMSLARLQNTPQKLQSVFLSPTQGRLV